MRTLVSPHRNERPAGTLIDLIVLHAISLPDGQFDEHYIEALFTGCLDCRAEPSFADLEGLKVSAHFVVGRSGRVTQFVACDERAWHAGVSTWNGRDGCNDFSIGIEMVGDERVPFTQAQYREVARVCRALMQRYPQITPDHIVGHQDVAPGRKWDPGRQWDWQRFSRSLSRIKNCKLELL
ncbi:1,6-anhydro-N-acetylmuramyl-L-alanine amidase AmpD [Mariprofundus erugo]|uniref:1,6-anhydro-N-acetylmuramyl-L-alanine amidase AmpD n=1 Tax=Mariprofundus erugo TaxID=2528639 RepID=A0A5R9GXH5_9PROT|nr:1,6-anhydro-N-acetylmuramyl-L-alanine amidase AmpD [Mariprofundus erugo]TLS68582.1 1,6-anhydro-N-acetylmuramyl-L-alanine amidase AmpD [Mariprofundus erugo]TLS76945.1 1,6-anhydro-N-acetylmuramyl-L-alanine amidase AmpD [Mariprofundus erugo]